MRLTSLALNGARAVITVAGLIAALGIAAPAAGAATGAVTQPGTAHSTGTSPATTRRLTLPGGRHVTLTGSRTVDCTKGSNGRLVSCPSRLHPPRLPAGARDHAIVNAPVTDLASLIDTRTWTSGGGNTFPGADVPFGMVQWSPDTMPDNNAGGGYNYGDEQLWGYSLTHLSGPGCGAAGDVPILPMTGALPSGDPSQATTSFTNNGEVAQAGYYQATSNLTDPITSQFTATPHSAMGRFTFPKTTSADFLVKLMGSQNGDAASSATVIGDDELQGSDTSGDFCGESDNAGQSQLYTVHFDIVFNHPFTASQVVTEPGATDPDSVFLTFNTTASPVIEAKVGISYVSGANARLDWHTENPGWNFDATKATAQASWNSLLSKISVWGGRYSQTQQFYSLLYKDFMQPNITSDVNGEFMGADMTVHHVVSGQQNQYGIYSGWDTYHSLSQLQAMLDPQAASDMAQSEVNYYSEDKILQQWGYLNLNNYVMVGDPMLSIIADEYAFGARGFDLKQALTDMVTQDTTTNAVNFGQAYEAKYGYLPEDGGYGCCGARGYVSTLLEDDNADFALSRFAAAMGDKTDAKMLENRANNWVNVFDSADGLLNPRFSNGDFEAGISGTTTAPYVEGDAYEYLWDVPNDYPGLFSLLGGNAKVVPELRQYLSEPNGFGMYAQLTNEFDLGEQNALDYAGDPAGTQAAVNNIRNDMYMPGPSGLANNDDLGANSSNFIWDMLGMYPENPGSGTLVFDSPGFPHAVISLPNGRAIVIKAPGASPSEYYVKSLSINGTADSKLYTSYSTLAKGATLAWTMSKPATQWGSKPDDAPPSYGPVFPDSVSASAATLYLQPSASASDTVSVSSDTSTPQSLSWTASGSGGVTTSPAGGTVTVPADGTATIPLTVTAGSTDGDDTVTVSFSTTAGTVSSLQIGTVVAKPGDLSPYYNVTAISDNGSPTTANYDGDGYSYSEQALTAAGLAPGAAVTSSGLTYTWPNVAASEPDSISAGGQTIPVSTPAGATTLGFLGSATNAASTGAYGTVTINYTDGTTSTATLGMSDWTLNAGGSSPSFGNTEVAKMPYRNAVDGTSQTVTTYIFAQGIPLDSSKTVASITLPATVTNGSIGIFAISAG